MSHESHAFLLAVSELGDGLFKAFVVLIFKSGNEEVACTVVSVCLFFLHFTNQLRTSEDLSVEG